MSDGKVNCWGMDVSGQLGDGGTATAGLAAPATVLGIDNATAVAAGDGFSCALLADGAIECWGSNNGGQLGDGGYDDSSVPVQVKGISHSVAISAGGIHTCAIASGGAVYCWGTYQGPQSDPSRDDGNQPRQVTGISGATMIATAIGNTCAIVSNGAVECWGYNDSGELGLGTTGDFTSKPRMIPGLAGVVAIAAGDEFECAIVEAGAVKCWGLNNAGQLGNGTNNDSWRPVPVTGISGATAIAAGDSHACAILADATVQCWGTDSVAPDGGATVNSSTPQPVADIAGAVAIAADGYTCTILSGSTIQCWGPSFGG